MLRYFMSFRLLTLLLFGLLHSARAADITREDFDRYWCSMRTFYVLTNDFNTFSKPARLLPYEMGSIDVIIRKENGLYHAILKDECEATAPWPTGKSVRVTVPRNLTGPYRYDRKVMKLDYHTSRQLCIRMDATGTPLF